MTIYGQASRSAAVRVTCSDGVARVHYYCRHCDAEQVNVTDYEWEEYGAGWGRSWCLVCHKKVWLRFVGRDPGTWTRGNTAIWQIDGPEVTDDEQPGMPAPAGAPASASPSRGGK